MQVLTTTLAPEEDNINYVKQGQKLTVGEYWTYIGNQCNQKVFQHQGLADTVNSDLGVGKITLKELMH